jgi:hypothetical protein
MHGAVLQAGAHHRNVVLPDTCYIVCDPMLDVQGAKRKCANTHRTINLLLKKVVEKIN